MCSNYGHVSGHSYCWTSAGLSMFRRYPAPSRPGRSGPTGCEMTRHDTQHDLDPARRQDS